MDKFLEKEKIRDFLKELSKEHDVFVPKFENGMSFFGLWEGEDFSPDYSNTKKSPKEILFPQFETLFSFKGNNVEVPPFDDKKKIIFGIRPCDAKAIKVLDFVFFKDPQDPYYVSRRKNTLIVSLACKEPCPTCFCTSVGGSPVGRDGADLIIYPLSHGYLISSVTESGEKILESFTALKDAKDKDKKEAEAFEKRVFALVPKIDIDSEKIADRLESISKDFFGRIYRKCLGCGICTYLCPTCHCFDIDDETKGDEGKRIRLWDSCMYPIYTLHASGHNPRPTGKERWEQRLMHKFNHFVRNHNIFGCVGCGRCVRYCPVNLDIRKVLEDAMKEEI